MYKTEKTYNVIQGKVPDFSGIYKEKLLNGADPVLDNEGKLIPVIIGNNGKVTKASLNSKWYSYADKQWANAVILKEGVETPEDNAEIDESNIESYFVWIPKYSYKLFDMGDYQSVSSTITDKGPTTSIEIKFGTDNTVDIRNTNYKNEKVSGENGEELVINDVHMLNTIYKNEMQCKTPGISKESGTCQIGDWMTHPAFIAFDTNGFWVGKFETSTPGSSKVEIKPNVTSWRNINVKTMFDTSYAYQRNLDSHMMKNTEWGAVAYLTQSIYGKCTSGNTCTKVVTNNNTSYLTGYSSTNIAYTTNTSVASSTTNNYSGIYDMSGGAWENVMALMMNEDNSTLALYLSGFSTTDFPFNNDSNNSKYYDVYIYGSNDTSYYRRILGDATAEFGPFKGSNHIYGSSWYNEGAAFIYPEQPWVSRGGGTPNYGIICGIFLFDDDFGIARGETSFRIVLAPQ